MDHQKPVKLDKEEMNWIAGNPSEDLPQHIDKSLNMDTLQITIGKSSNITTGLNNDVNISTSTISAILIAVWWMLKMHANVRPYQITLSFKRETVS